MKNVVKYTLIVFTVGESIALTTGLVAEQAHADGEPSAVAGLIKALGSDDFNEREKAETALRKLGRVAFHTLDEYVNDDDVEIRARVGGLLPTAEQAAAHLKAIGCTVRSDPDDTRNRVVMIKFPAKGIDLSEYEYLRYAGDVTALAIDGDITDAELDNLKGLRRVVNLSISSRRITDEGLARLGACRSIMYLHLGKTKINGEGMKCFKGWDKLVTLTLNDTNLDDAGLGCLENFPNLQNLTISNTRVTDRGLVHLEKVRKLGSISLQGTDVTDAGLESLRKCESLELVVASSKMSVEALAELKKGRPKLRVITLRGG